VDLLKSLEDMCKYMSHLDHRKRKLIWNSLSVKAYWAGSVIFDAGDEPIDYMIVLYGSVKIVRKSSNWSLLGLLKFGRGCALGEHFLLKNLSYTSRCTTLEDTTVLMIPAHVYHTILGQKILSAIDQKTKFMLTHIPQARYIGPVLRD